MNLGLMKSEYIDEECVSEVEDETEELQKLLNNKKFVPVALVLESATEHHDIFKQLLLQLFNLIREPEPVKVQGYKENKILAFAEMVAHIAFLKTLPAPPFNTVYNINFLNKNFVIKESPFD